MELDGQMWASICRDFYVTLSLSLIQRDRGILGGFKQGKEQTLDNLTQAEEQRIAEKQMPDSGGLN